MTTWFVNSGAAGLNNGTSWTDAWVSAASSNGVAAGDIVKVHKTHSETTLAASVNWANGTLSNPVKIVCVDKDASDALATGAVIGFNTTNVGPQGNIYARGITFSDSGATLRITIPTGGNAEFDTCIFISTSTGGVQIGDATLTRFYCRWKNCNIDFSGATNASVALSLAAIISGSIFRWMGGTYTCRSTQTNLFNGSGSTVEEMFFNSVTFSGTVTNLINSSAGAIGRYYFDNCLAPTYTNVFSAAPTSYSSRVNLNGLLGGTLSAALIPPIKQIDVTGTISADASRYRTTGASDGSNPNPYSWAMASNSTANNFTTPLTGPPLTRWINAGSQTITVYVASGVTLHDDEFWLRIISPSEAGTPTPLGTSRWTRMAALGTPAALTTDGTSTWNGSGVGTQQKISVTIAPTVAGFVTIYPDLALPSTTVYLDPVIDVGGDVNGLSRFGEGVQQFASTPSVNTAAIFLWTAP